MAMLAEPRRKQKWSVDPRNSTWSNDETKFGHKMLEKMGWSKGKGLGAQEQGSTEHVKVQLKNNTLGLGATSNHEDNWIAHQDDFNQLLAELNNCHGTGGSAASSDNENKKSFSLEEKSKSSKKRVHYMKFAKGKDLSSRSDTDLACIFGKREKAKKSLQEKTDSEPEESESRSPSHNNEVESENTVISSLSVNEYFAKRMAELKKSYAKREDRVAEPCPEDDGEHYPEDTKKKSKKKKRRKNDNDDCSEEPKESGNPEDENDVDTTECQERRRKPKSKKEDKTPTAENPEDHEEEEDKNETLRKKKKKNKRKKESCDERQTEDVTSTPDEDLDAVQLKKKKKRKRERTEA